MNLYYRLDPSLPHDQPLPHLHSTTKRAKKVVVINAQEISHILISLLRNRFPNLKIVLYSREDLKFIEEHRENLFSDALSLKNVIEKCNALFANSLVVSITISTDPVFNLFLNKVLHEAKIPWFFASIDGPFVYVGPLFSGKYCFECLELRILMNSKKTEEYLRYKQALTHKKITQACSIIDESIKMLASSLACLEISHYLVTGRCIAKHKLLSLFMPTMEFRYHKMLRVSGCRVCSVGNTRNGSLI